MERGSKRWRRRATALSVGFCSLGALLLVGSEWLFPAPTHADAAALRRWLALRDVARQPAETQLALVDRIQAAVSPEDLLPDPKRSSSLLAHYLGPQVRRNATALKRTWFEARCAQYGRVPPEQRMEFLERQIAFLLAWMSGFSVGDESSGSSSGSSVFFDELAEWTRQATGEKRRELQRGIRDGIVCWLATSDVERLPGTTRKQLTERLAAELSRARRSSGEVSDFRLPLSVEQASRLRGNAWLLIETWVHLRAREFAELPRDQRDAYVDGRIDEVLRWDLALYLGPPSGGPASSATPSSPALAVEPSGFAAMGPGPGEDHHQDGQVRGLASISLAQLSHVWQEVARWTDRADPDTRAELEPLLRHLQWRLIARTLPQLGPRLGPRLGRRGTDQADSPSP